jgi:uncharacterized protein YhaN
MTVDRLIMRAIAGADAEEQAAFLATFADELRQTCGGTRGRMESQLCYLAGALPPYAREMVASLAAFCSLADEEDTQRRSESQTLRRDIQELHEEISRLQAQKRALEES